MFLIRRVGTVGGVISATNTFYMKGKVAQNPPLIRCYNTKDINVWHPLNNPLNLISVVGVGLYVGILTKLNSKHFQVKFFFIEVHTSVVFGINIVFIYTH